MSVYNITGWSGGGRRPLTYNLRAGQFRNMGGCNVFGTPTRTIINNNFGGGCGYGYDCDCDHNDGEVPNFIKLLMGGGMVMNFFGQIMSAIFPAKESKDAKGADGKGGLTDAQKTDLAAYKSTYSKECTISGPLSNGSFIVVDKTGKAEQKRTTVSSFDDLVAHLETTYDKTAEEPEKPEKPVITDDMKALATALGITIETGTDGQPVYKVGESEFKELPAAISKAREKSTSNGTLGTASYSLSNFKVHDAKRGSNYDISGTVTATWEKTTNGQNDQTKPPTSLTVISGSNTYVYNKGTTNVEYDEKSYPVYTLASINGNTNVNKQTYILVDGQLIQPEDLTSLEGLGTGSKITGGG